MKCAEKKVARKERHNMHRESAVKSGIVGGQAVVLGTGTAMPKWHQAPHHWLDNIHVF